MSSSPLLPPKGPPLTPQERHHASPVFQFYCVSQTFLATISSLTVLLAIYKRATGRHVQGLLVFAFFVGAVFFMWNGRRAWAKRGEAKRRIEEEEEEELGV